MHSRYPRLSLLDRSALRIERADTPAHIAGLCFLTAGPLLDASGALDLEMIKRRLECRLVCAPALRTIIQPAPPLGGPPLWVDDPQFSINRHVYAVRLAPPGDSATLFRTVELVLRQLLDRSHPLWQFWFFTGLEGDQVGMLVKVHHAFADGGAAVALVMSLLDLTPDTPDPPAVVWAPVPAPSPSALFRNNLGSRVAAIRSTLADLAQVAHNTSATLGDTARFLRRLNAAPRTSLNGLSEPACRISALSLDLRAVRAVARAYRVKVNDVVLSVASGGLRELLIARGEPVAGKVLTALVPTTLRTGQIAQIAQIAGQAGNEVGLMLEQLPVGEPDALGRLMRVAALTKATKATQHPGYISGLLGIGSVFGLARPFLAFQRMINIFVTNVPGPPMPLYFLGAKIEDVLPIIGPGGNVTLMLSAFSYCDRLNLLLDVRASAYPDIDELVHGMRRSWEELIARGMQPGAMFEG
jgi:WS/DGAT/MGAT family acyltransferase